MELNLALDLLWEAVGRSNQAVVADEVGVSPATLSRWKNGDTVSPKTRQRLIKWAEAYAAADSAAFHVTRGRRRPIAGAGSGSLFELRGRSLEVEALMRFALERQAALSEALARAGANDEEMAAAVAISEDALRESAEPPATAQSTRRQARG